MQSRLSSVAITLTVWFAVDYSLRKVAEFYKPRTLSTLTVEDCLSILKAVVTETYPVLTDTALILQTDASATNRALMSGKIAERELAILERYGCCDANAFTQLCEAFAAQNEVLNRFVMEMEHMVKDALGGALPILPHVFEPNVDPTITLKTIATLNSKFRKRILNRTKRYIEEHGLENCLVWLPVSTDLTFNPPDDLAVKIQNELREVQGKFMRTNEKCRIAFDHPNAYLHSIAACCRDANLRQEVTLLASLHLHKLINDLSILPAQIAKESGPLILDRSEVSPKSYISDTPMVVRHSESEPEISDNDNDNQIEKTCIKTRLSRTVLGNIPEHLRTRYKPSIIFPPFPLVSDAFSTEVDAEKSETLADSTDNLTSDYSSTEEESSEYDGKSSQYNITPIYTNTHRGSRQRKFKPKVNDVCSSVSGTLSVMEEPLSRNTSSRVIEEASRIVNKHRRCGKQDFIGTKHRSAKNESFSGSSNRHYSSRGTKSRESGIYKYAPQGDSDVRRGCESELSSAGISGCTAANLAGRINAELMRGGGGQRKEYYENYSENDYESDRESDENEAVHSDTEEECIEGTEEIDDSAEGIVDEHEEYDSEEGCSEEAEAANNTLEEVEYPNEVDESSEDCCSDECAKNENYTHPSNVAIDDNKANENNTQKYVNCYRIMPDGMDNGQMDAHGVISHKYSVKQRNRPIDSMKKKNQFERRIRKYDEEMNGNRLIAGHVNLESDNCVILSDASDIYEDRNKQVDIVQTETQRNSSDYDSETSSEEDYDDSEDENAKCVSNQPSSLQCDEEYSESDESYTDEGESVESNTRQFQEKPAPQPTLTH